MKIGKGVVTGLGIAGLLIALPAGATDSKGASQSSGSSGSTYGPATGGSSASSQTGSQMGSESEGGSAASKMAAAGASGEQQLTGTVKKIDRSRKQLTLQLRVDESTQVMKNGKAATLADIKEGDQVRASFSGDQVDRIEVMSSGASGETGGSQGSGRAPVGGPGPASGEPPPAGRGY